MIVIDAMAEMPSNIYYIIAGKGSLEEELRRSAEERGLR